MRCHVAIAVTIKICIYKRSIGVDLNVNKKTDYFLIDVLQIYIALEERIFADAALLKAFDETTIFIIQRNCKYGLGNQFSSRIH